MTKPTRLKPRSWPGGQPRTVRRDRGVEAVRRRCAGVKRWEAGLAMKRCGYLQPSERLVFLTLLEHADNSDCAIPERMTPTLAQLGDWTALDRRTVQRSIQHLDQHKWLAREPGRGRGHRSGYRLVPVDPDGECRCEKAAPRHPLSRRKGGMTPPFSERKGGVSAQEKAACDFTEPAESLTQEHLSTKGREGEETKGACQRCDRPQPEWVLASRDGMCIDCARRAAS
jgi:hypothetical protein